MELSNLLQRLKPIARGSVGLEEMDKERSEMDLVNRMRLQAEDLHALNPASETVKCLSIGADEIARLREQVAELESDRDDWIDCHAKIFRELQETKTLVGNKCAEVAADESREVKP